MKADTDLKQEEYSCRYCGESCIRYGGEINEELDDFCSDKCSFRYHIGSHP